MHANVISWCTFCIYKKSPYNLYKYMYRDNELYPCIIHKNQIIVINCNLRMIEYAHAIT